MKAKAFLIALMFFAASCSSLSGLDSTINTTSPQKTYRVIVEGRPDPPGMFATVQQVRLRVLKSNIEIFTDEKFYREEVDHLFTAEYPAHEWLNDSVLRFGKGSSANAPKEKVTIVNNTGDKIDLAKIQYSILNEKFMVFDLGAGQTAELELILVSSDGKDSNPELHCTAYVNGKSFASIVNRWQRNAGHLVGYLVKS